MTRRLTNREISGVTTGLKRRPRRKLASTDTYWSLRRTTTLVKWPVTASQRRTLEALDAVFDLNYGSQLPDGTVIVGHADYRNAKHGRSIDVDRRGRVQQNSSTTGAPRPNRAIPTNVRTEIARLRW